MTAREFLLTWKRLDISHHCFYCGVSIEVGVDAGLFQSSKEHVYGHVSPDNLWVVKACVGCNGAKSCCTIPQFRAWSQHKTFYCETIVGAELPAHAGLDIEVIKWAKADKVIIDKHIMSKRLSSKIKAIIKDCRKNGNYIVNSHK